jgi:hypothetical protein
VTLLTVAAVALTVLVAAVTIGTFQGGKVTIGGVASSTVTYSLDNVAGPYAATLEPSTTSTSWFTRLEIGDGSYNGPVQITWQLQQETANSTWTAVSGASTTTNIILTGNAENVYASSDGTTTGNYDWSSNVNTLGTYRVLVTVESEQS